MKFIKKICCLGAGYVGGPTMAVIADKCPHIKVTVLDLNEKRINAWNDHNLNNLPVFEPGLQEIIARVRGKNLFFSSDFSGIIEDSEMVFISVNTPTKKTGFGKGYASDLKWVEACARQVAENSEGHTIVVEKSTLPVRTAAVIQKILFSSLNKDEFSNKKKSFSVLSNPEFLSEGNAISDLTDPDRVLIGGEDEDSISALKSIYGCWVSEKKILTTNIWSSELSKLSANAFLAQRISSINAVSAICEVTGARIGEVANAIGSDSRIGNKFLKAGPGFGGSCFKKDILNLVYLCNHFGLSQVADYWEQVVKINDWQTQRISKLIVEKLFGTVSSKKIAVLGFSFKANTNDIRESPAINIVKDLIENGAHVVINDPKVDPLEIKKEFTKYDDLTTNSCENGSWVFMHDKYQAIKESDAVLILTEWKDYENLDWEKISKLMRKPSWVFDTRLITDQNEISKTDLNYWSIGGGST